MITGPTRRVRLFVAEIYGELKGTLFTRKKDERIKKIIQTPFGQGQIIEPVFGRLGIPGDQIALRGFVYRHV
jgi:hypothetical protein